MKENGFFVFNRKHYSKGKSSKPYWKNRKKSYHLSFSLSGCILGKLSFGREVVESSWQMREKKT